jgi:CheY-like chemotaxis protein
MVRILVVDDEGDHALFVATLLKREGHHVTAATSGAMVINALNRFAFDMVITDIVMPDVEGIEVIRRVKKAHPRCGVIAMSGGGRYDGSDEYLRIAEALGAEATLAKPFSIVELRTAIAHAMKVTKLPLPTRAATAA